jgi:16S rRNA (guanine527-N7)-methyltransferase
MSAKARMDQGGELATVIGRFELSDRTADALQTFIAAVEGEKRRSVVLMKWRTGAALKTALALAGLDLDEVRNARKMVDIGSGAGFPSLPLAASLPDTDVTLVELHDTRCEFLRNTADAMGLSNVTVRQTPIEEWTDGIGTCDLVTSQAVYTLSLMVGWAAPLLAPGGSAVLYSGARRPDHEAEASSVAESAGLRTGDVREVTLTDSLTRYLHVYHRD